MKKKTLISLICSVVLLLVFVAFTLIVKFVDLSLVGNTGKEIGLSSINSYFYLRLKPLDIWHTLSNIIFVLALFIAVAFVIVGIYQLVTRKSLNKIDKDIVAVISSYALVALVYVFFELVVVNFRPILIDGVVEASYPSSHVMISLVVITSAVMFLCGRVNTKIKKVLAIVSGVMLSLMVIIFRILSARHWITDIIAGVIIAFAILSCYVLITNIINKKGDGDD